MESQHEYLVLQLISALNFDINNYINSVFLDFSSNKGKNLTDIARIVSIGSYNNVLAIGYNIYISS